jgi:7,8-dihydropterin-6-yl-methyl-4-(beta-D-ribofuranosyl)aminobenzene 5'-phosphate synthase
MFAITEDRAAVEVRAAKRDVMRTDVQITVLVDDEAGKGLAREHGFSLWIEADGKRILFDTGQGGVLLGNAEKLGIGLSETDVVVLSHGHYDHTDGLPGVVALATEARVVVHQDALVTRYSIRSSGPPKAVGMSSETRAALKGLPVGRITWSAQQVMVTPSMGVTGTIARATSFEDTGGPFFLDAHGRTADPIMDDQALWIDTGEGVVVCVGCCHAGLINTLHAVQRASGTARIRAVVGGFHLLSASERRLGRTLDALRSIGPEMLVPCHCTGQEAIGQLQEAFGDLVSIGCSGVTFRFASGPCV